MEAWMAAYIGEMALAIIAGLVAWGFKSWSSQLKDSTNRILDMLESLTADFHDHKMEVERRVTRIETKVDIVHDENLEWRRKDKE